MRVSISALVIGALHLGLPGCATPEELAAAQERRERQSQTGTNITRRDTGARTDVVTDKTSTDTLLNEMRGPAGPTTLPQGAGR